MSAIHGNSTTATNSITMKTDTIVLGMPILDHVVSLFKSLYIAHTRIAFIQSTTINSPINKKTAIR